MLPVFLLIATAFQAPVLRLSPLFSDGAVLQRGARLPIFGVAAPGSTVRVEIGGQRAEATTDREGRWLVRVAPLQVGGPYALTARSGGETVFAHDLLCGEVWIAAGQSNMEMPEALADDYPRARGETRPDVRMFTVEKATADVPQSRLSGRWERSTPQAIGRMSAVGLAFARELNQKLNVPVGIVLASWGGTPAEAWTSRQALVGDPDLKPLVDAYDAAQAGFPAQIAAYRKAVSEFVNFKHNGGNEGFMHDWQALEADETGWSTVPAGTLLPAEFDGAAWYRKSVDVPPAWVGKPLVLELGPIDDYDTTYFDGIRVGRTGAEDDNGDATTPRRYRISPGIVRPGPNVIAVRVFDDSGPGGLTGPVSGMRLSLADGSDGLALDGDWRFRVERALDPKTQIPQRPFGPGNPNVPTTLFNAMIAPLIPYSIRGALWYQGEANADRAAQYRRLLPTLIRDWRTRWGVGAFPFEFVQLPNYLARQTEPSESRWAETREAQAMALTLRNTGMAVTIDLGDAADIHPKDKREVGRRLALIALGRTYRLPVVYEGPSFSALRVDGSTARVDFRNGALTTTDGAPPRGFQIAGSDGKWVWAETAIDGSTVRLRATGVTKPIAVRYAWADNPDVNLVNRAGLPAAPFRTDAG